MKKWIDAIKNKLKATHRYWIYGGVSICLLFILSFASATHSSINCRSVDVLITDENEYHFVSQKEILNTLTNQGTEQIVGFPISGIQLKNIENTLLQNSFISSAEAYINMKGDLRVSIQQRVPVLRVYNQRGEAYYLDSKGNVMPLSDHYSARVVVASTPYEAKENDSIINHLNAKLFALANAINKDSFLFALTGQIAFDSAQEFSIIPRMGNFEIVLGDTSVLEDKFIRLRSFYKSALPQEGWEKYSTISLKYKHQVIATRKELANE